MEITNAVGNKTGAKVDESNRLHTLAVSETEFLSINENEKQAYTWNFPRYDYSAGDTVMWLRNDSNLNLHIHHVYLYCDTATDFFVHKPVSTVAAGTSVTPCNINFTSANIAEATAFQDETTNVTGDILQTEYIAANGTVSILKEEGYEVILGKNDIFAIDIVTEGTGTLGHIVGFFKA